jgi:acyl-coenzyme A synthetase/AMP-(fatty) acid ligase
MRSIDNYIEIIRNGNDNEAIIIDNKSYSYKALYLRIDFYYNKLLEKGIRKGQKVIILGDYSFESISVFFALAKNSNIIIPIASDNKNENQLKIHESKPNWLISFSDFSIKLINEDLDSQKLLLDLAKDNIPGLILFSSGTTGKPKVMLHSLDNLFNSYLNKRKRNLTFLVFLMFDHIGGINTLLNILSMNAKLVIPNTREPDKICRLIQDNKINILPASPTFLNLILISKAYNNYDLSSLIMITYGTEPMPSNLLLRLRNFFPKVKFLQTFGTSETGIIKTSSKSSASTLMKFDDPNQKHKIVDGELFLKSKTQVLGYLNYNNDCFTEGGWFKTGDLVEETSDGFIKIIGRKNEVINIGGEKVNPLEVENLILNLDYVSDCTVYSNVHPIMGQIMIARIVSNYNLTEKELKKNIRMYCKNNIEKYKIPSKFIIVRDFKYNNRFKKIRKYDKN